MDLDRLQSLTGMNALVNFPTRGDACLDNCLTNCPDLFGICYPIQVLMRTDHKGVILPAGTKLKPIRHKYKIRDCRDHRKIAFYQALAEEIWDDVFTTTNIDEVVNNLESKICGHMDACMPLRTVTISSRDPAWITPLVKYMLRAKSRVSNLNAERLKLVNKRISEVIFDNRRNLGTPSRIGSRDWWKRVDSISQRKLTSRMSFNDETLLELNKYFGRLCYDDNYIEPMPLEISDEVDIPVVNELQVWYKSCTQEVKEDGYRPRPHPVLGVERSC